MTTGGATNDAKRYSVALPEALVRKIDPWPEYRMGVKRVAVVLKDGRVFKPAFVSGHDVRKVGSAEEPIGPIPFSTDDIADVLDDWSD